ncbi:MAG: cysteine--tRNA ligase [Candidatus Gracilibacteria bacterium]|nr:cysteine--tRNA ligase [Candidatus Gracilibacteria bacterium]
MLKLFNTIRKEKQEFRPINKDEVKMYSCGPTVYNYPHVGNLRAFIFADTLYRWLKYGEKCNVKWVMNLTDVDDKTIKNSREKYPKMDEKTALSKYTLYYEGVFFDDLAELNIQKESFFNNPRATEYIEEMKDLTRMIYEKGYAKIIEGSVFFDLVSYVKSNDYGKLINLDLDNLKTGTRTLSDEIEKENVQDFVLWKGVKKGEPYWDFELDGHDLKGRPGWHIECSSMGHAILGLPLDIHTGGVDLTFPHHENEIAQAQAGYELDTANFWLHNEHLMVDGKKMSKSLGNFYTLADLREKGFSAEAIRFFFVFNHYGSKVNLSDESLEAASNTLKNIRNLLSIKKEGSKDIVDIRDRFYGAMRDDLNTSVALACMMELLKGDYKKDEVSQFFKEAEDIFGIYFFEKNVKIPQDIIDLAERRVEAKKQKDYQLADSLRNEIIAKGYELRDTQGGYEIKKQGKKLKKELFR